MNSKNQNLTYTKITSVRQSIKSLLLITAILLSSLVSATTSIEADEAKAITTEVRDLLKNPKILLEKDELVKVTITFNENNEIVVLSVDSENDEVEAFIKNRLNYNKLAYKLYNKKQTIIIPIKLDIEE
jgi:hypothetical protein